MISQKSRPVIFTE